jgi:hypothetical protein
MPIGIIILVLSSALGLAPAQTSTPVSAAGASPAYVGGGPY